MSYETVLRNLSESTAQLVQQLWAAVVAGRLSRHDFLNLTAELVATARLRGAAVAETAFRGYLEASTTTPTPAAVSTTLPERDRLGTALRTILANEALDTDMQLTRLASNEPLTAAADAYHHVMQRSAIVSGWRRGLDANPCQLCLWWARDGRVWRPEHAMPRHPGCACRPIPVVNETTTNHQTASQAAGALTNR